MTFARAASLPILAVLTALGCGGDDDYGSNPSGCTPSATQVCMTSSTFNPTSLTIATGTTVTWRNGSAVSHTVTSNAGAPAAFDADVGPGGTFSRQFTTVGTHNYHCDNHVGMTGTVTVN